jgi:hypothetical protein
MRAMFISCKKLYKTLLFFFKYRTFLIYRATIVQDKSTFWTNQRSEIIQITRNENVDIYEGCGTIKTCLGVPNNCVRMKSCEYMGMVTVRDQIYNFELKSPSKYTLSV